MSLFDPAAFETWAPTRRTPAPPVPAADAIAVTVDRTWRAVSRRQPGIVHAVHTVEAPSVQFGGGAVIAWCGARVVPMTLQVGDVVAGCPLCAAHGAPVVPWFAT